MVVEDIPKKQKALVFETVGGPLEVKEIDVPEVGPEDILVKVMYSGICHSDLHIWLGDLPLLPQCPLVGGHEGAGIVVKIGSNVTNFKVGDRAGIKWINGTCRACENCKRGFDPNCPFGLYSGFSRNGTFQQYALAKAIEANHIPDGLDLAAAAPILCAGLTVYRALKESNVQAGQIVAITGAGGGLGSLAIQYARAMGMRVLAVDVGEAKEKHCKALGAEFFVDAIATPNIVETITKLTNGGPHGVINVATAQKPIEQSTQYVRTRGTVVLVSLPKDAKVTIDIFSAVMKTITIKGSYVGNRQDADEALDFIARHSIKVPLEIVTLEDVKSVYDKMLNGTITSRSVIDLWK